MRGPMVGAALLAVLTGACAAGDDVGLDGSSAPDEIAADCADLDDTPSDDDPVANDDRPAPGGGNATGGMGPDGPDRGEASDRSFDELDALAEEVSADMRAGHERASQDDRRDPEPGTIQSVALQEHLNRVAVGVIDGDEAVLAELSERYGAERICLERFEPSTPPDPDGPVTPLAKAGGWRDGLSEPASSFAIVEIAYDRDTAGVAWADNVPDDLTDADDPAESGVFSSLDDVDFDTQAVVVWSSGQSSSCPEWLADIATGEDGTVRLDTASAGGPVCTSDYNPYRMVTAVDRDRLPEPEALPTENIDGVPDARVTTYSDEG